MRGASPSSSRFAHSPRPDARTVRLTVPDAGAFGGGSIRSEAVGHEHAPRPERERVEAPRLGGAGSQTRPSSRSRVAALPAQTACSPLGRRR